MRDSRDVYIRYNPQIYGGLYEFWCALVVLCVALCCVVHSCRCAVDWFVVCGAQCLMSLRRSRWSRNTFPPWAPFRRSGGYNQLAIVPLIRRVHRKSPVLDSMVTSLYHEQIFSLKSCLIGTKFTFRVIYSWFTRKSVSSIHFELIPSTLHVRCVRYWRVGEWLFKSGFRIYDELWSRRIES